MADDITAGDIDNLATQFDNMCNSRMQFGQEKYGDFTWLEAPTIQMILEELADVVNYARMNAVKIMLMANYLASQSEPPTMGNEGFQPNNPGRV